MHRPTDSFEDARWPLEFRNRPRSAENQQFGTRPEQFLDRHGMGLARIDPLTLTSRVPACPGDRSSTVEAE